MRPSGKHITKKSNKAEPPAPARRPAEESEEDFVRYLPENFPPFPSEYVNIK